MASAMVNGAPTAAAASQPSDKDTSNVSQSTPDNNAPSSSCEKSCDIKQGLGASKKHCTAPRLPIVGILFVLYSIMLCLALAFTRLRVQESAASMSLAQAEFELDIQHGFISMEERVHQKLDTLSEVPFSKHSWESHASCLARGSNFMDSHFIYLPYTDFSDIREAAIVWVQDTCDRQAFAPQKFRSRTRHIMQLRPWLRLNYDISEVYRAARDRVIAYKAWCWSRLSTPKIKQQSRQNTTETRHSSTTTEHISMPDEFELVGCETQRCKLAFIAPSSSAQKPGPNINEKSREVVRQKVDNAKYILSQVQLPYRRVSNAIIATTILIVAIVVTCSLSKFHGFETMRLPAKHSRTSRVIEWASIVTFMIEYISMPRFCSPKFSYRGLLDSAPHVICMAAASCLVDDTTSREYSLRSLGWDLRNLTLGIRITLFVIEKSSKWLRSALEPSRNQDRPLPKKEDIPKIPINPNTTLQQDLDAIRASVDAALTRHISDQYRDQLSSELIPLLDTIGKTTKLLERLDAVSTHTLTRSDYNRRANGTDDGQEDMREKKGGLNPVYERHNFHELIRHMIHFQSYLTKAERRRRKVKERCTALEVPIEAEDSDETVVPDSGSDDKWTVVGSPG